jgi:ubiquinone biosynthesis protein
LDLTHEGQSTDRLRRYFEDDDNIVFPIVYWEATTRDVLTLEEIRGIRLSRMATGDLTPEERRQVMCNGADAVFRQCLEFGFFHADPHPGNIFALTGGRVCFIDCGMTGRIDRRTSENLAELVAGVLLGDLDRVIRVVLLLTNSDSSFAQDRAFREDTWELISRFESTSLERLDIGRLLDDLFELSRRYRIRCPSDLVFLIKALTTIEGVGELVDPTFDLVGYVRPHIERLLARRYGLRAIAGRLQRGLLSYADLAEDLPGELRSLLAQLRGNRFSINLEHKRLDRLTETIEHASRNIAYALVIAALLVGSSIVTLTNQGMASDGLLPKVGLLGLVVAAGLSLLLLVANYRRGKR